MKLAILALAVTALILLSGCVEQPDRVNDPTGVEHQPETLEKHGATMPGLLFLFRKSGLTETAYLGFIGIDWGNGWNGPERGPVCWEGSNAGENINYFYCLEFRITRKVIDPDGTINPTETIRLENIIIDPVDEGDRELLGDPNALIKEYWVKQAKIISMTVKYSK